jgi:acyl-CoA synthetase (AMP-forming)/AMP-acid ligase II/aryl carrier-like protein
VAAQGYAADPLATGVGTVAGLLRARAEDQPDRLGYTFLADGETQELELTYGQADSRASAVAAALRDAGASVGDRAVLMLPPGLDYVNAFFGCLYASVVAVPVYPPDPFQLERTLPRLRSIVRDADPVVALTIAPLLEPLKELTRQAPEMAALRWVAVDEAPDDATERGPVVVPTDATAMLQYTSGSTSTPKGVMLSHRNLLHNSGLIQHFFGTTQESRGASWLPPYHDMGLIGGLIQPLYGGFPIVLMSPLHFLQEPERWLRAVDRFRVTATGGPNFAYDLCVRKTDPEEIARLDLSCWEVAFNGAEPIRPATLRRFAEAFAPSGFSGDAFLPCYGLAEATLIVSGARTPARAVGTVPPVVPVDREALKRGLAKAVGSDEDGVQPARELVHCGHSAPGQRIAIVDPATSVARLPGRVGEIWVSGQSVAGGYWRQPEESGRVFDARVAGEGDDTPFLRTGDLGFLSDGQLVVTGRLKDLIIVRGRNHYPQDIEHTAEATDPVLRPGCTAAFLADEDGGSDDLILVHEVRRDADEVDTGRLVARIRQAVAEEHGLQVHTVVLLHSGGLPKTSSGKVQRRLCQTQFLAGELPEIGRTTTAPAAQADSATAGAAEVLSGPPERRAVQLEYYLRTVVAAVSGVGLDNLDREQALTSAGLDSLAVLQLQQRVENDLGLSVPLAPLLTGASLVEVAEALDKQSGVPSPDTGLTVTPLAGGAAEDAVPLSREHVPLTLGQRAIWFSQQFEPTSSVHNIAVALRSLEPVDGSVLRRALDSLVARHAMLRTTFPVRDGAPVMLVRPHGRAAFREHDAHELDHDALVRRLVSTARRPFVLEAGPLLRVDLHHRPDGDVILLTMHHIVTDFWSMTVFARELGAYCAAYAAGTEPALAAPAATYLDVVERQRRILDDPAHVNRLADYWDGQLGDGAPPLRLQASADAQSAPGAARPLSLSAPLTASLRRRAATECVTLYTLLLAAFQALLHLRTGQDNLTVGTNAAARVRPEFAQVIGCCANPVMVRSRTLADPSFRELLHQTRDRVVEAMEHQEYPMALLADRHGLGRRGEALFEALFTFNRSPEHGDDLAALAALGPAGLQRSLGPLRVENFPLPYGETSLPLELVMAEIDETLHGILRYRAGTFGEGDAARLIEEFTSVLEAVAADPDVCLGTLLPDAPRTGPATACKG